MIPDDDSWPKHVGRWLGIRVSLLVQFFGILLYTCVWLHSFNLFLFFWFNFVGFIFISV